MAAQRRDISITARAKFSPEHSDVDAGRYVFAYTITIKNTGDIAAQLLSRHWIIADANGELQEVRGEGVVGEQPLLKPGESFEYTSAAAIATAVGTMRGSYRFVDVNRIEFDAPIPEFTLAMPRVLH